MAALTDNIEVIEKDGVVHDGPMAVDIIYRGAIVMHNAAGYLAPAASGNGSYFAGIAEEKKDNSAGSAGDINCRYKRDGVYLLTGAGFAQTDIGEKVYASDDQTITKTATTNVLVGQVVEFVSATQVYVRLERNSVVSAT
jgi:predicted RecA/RadA family phage recombinase